MNGDSKIVRIIEDLSVLRERAREDRGEVQEDIREYFERNRDLIFTALKAYGRKSEKQRELMQSGYRELDSSPIPQSFYESVALPILRNLTEGQFEVSSDNLHMIQRALQFSKYIVNTSKEEVDSSVVEASQELEGRLDLSQCRLKKDELGNWTARKKYDLGDSLESYVIGGRNG